MILIDETLDTPTHTVSNSAQRGAATTSVNPWTKAAQAAVRSNAEKAAAAAAASQPLKKKRKNRSCVWDYYTKSADQKSVVCKSENCHWKALFQGGSTTNMRNHLQTDHLDLYEEMINDEKKKKLKGEHGVLMSAAHANPKAMHNAATEEKFMDAAIVCCCDLR